MDPITPEERLAAAEIAERLAAAIEQGGFETFEKWAESLTPEQLSELSIDECLTTRTLLALAPLLDVFGVDL